MSFTLNRIMLIGHIGQDAKLTKHNKSEVANFTLATTHGIKQQDGSYNNITTWHNVAAWNFTKTVTDNLKKGEKIYIEGRIGHLTFKDKSGNEQKSTQVIADQIILLQKK